MRLAVSAFLALSFCAFAGCSPVDIGGENSTNGAGDPSWTTGGDAGSASNGGDAGSAGSGSDAGSASSGSDAGSAGSGSDAGSPGIPSACDGIVPAVNPIAHSVVVPHGTNQVCFNFTADGQGNVAAESHAGSPNDTNWKFWSANAAMLGSAIAGFDFQSQPSGFASTRRDSGSTYFVRLSSSGQEVQRTLLGSAGCRGETSFSAPQDPLILGGCAGGPLQGRRFDIGGNGLASAAIAPVLVDAVGVLDQLGKTLVVSWPGTPLGSQAAYVARWFDASLTPLGNWFDLPGSGGARPALRPLIGGGVAVQISGSWVAGIASGVSRPDAPPPFLAARPKHDFQIVRQGRAYALIPRSGAAVPRNQLELFDAEGERCGQGTFPAEGLSVARDGTVLGSGGPGGCNLAWWPGILR